METTSTAGGDGFHSSLEPWFSSRTKSLTKSPKLYLADTGLLCVLVGIEELDELMQSPFAGAVWETLVCSELRRQIKNRQRRGTFRRNSC